MMKKQPDSPRLEAFLSERRRLLRLAYRYLGSAADAEDIVQEAWLRFEKVDEVADSGKLLAVIVSRLCLDRLKSARVRRETYVGPWLPEPALNSVFDVQDDTSLDISFAVMRVLERLSPAECAAYFLHDLWDIPFEEVSEILARSPAACRQLAARARKSLKAERRRFAPTMEQIRQTSEVFRKAVEAGKPDALIALLADNAELISDGGGKVLAALNILHGANNIGRFLFGISGNYKEEDIQTEIVTINDQQAYLLVIQGNVDQIFAFDTNTEGKVATIYMIRNPDKLRNLKKAFAN